MSTRCNKKCCRSARGWLKSPAFKRSDVPSYQPFDGAQDKLRAVSIQVKGLGMNPGFHRGDDKAGMTEGKSTSSRQIQNPSAWSRGLFSCLLCAHFRQQQL